MTLRCPSCRSIQVGKVGTDQYYCWNCFIEFNNNKGRVSLYEVAEDGTLLNMSENPDIIS